MGRLRYHRLGDNDHTSLILQVRSAGMENGATGASKKCFSGIDSLLAMRRPVKNMVFLLCNIHKLCRLDEQIQGVLGTLTVKVEGLDRVRPWMRSKYSCLPPRALQYSPPRR